MFGFWKVNRKLNQAETLANRRQFADAEKIIAELRAQKPDDATLMLHEAVLAFEQKELPRSKALIEKALELQQDNPILHLALGEILYVEKDYDASRQALQKSLQLSPGNPKAEYLLGMNSIAENRFDDAALHFESVAREDQAFLLSRLLTVGESLLRQHRQQENS